MTRRTQVVVLTVVGILVLLSACTRDGTTPPPPSPSPAKSFSDKFQDQRVIEESNPIEESADPNWWLNSGARLDIRDGVAQTIQGSLDPEDPWHRAYASNSGADRGRHPQNLFRLVLRQEYQNPEQQFYFRVDQINLSKDPERDAWSGVFSMSRYGDQGDTLYYTGFRVDGSAVIKKKVGGVYADSLAEVPVFDGAEYDRTKNPNLLPEDRWIGLRSAVTTNANRTVSITLWVDVDGNGLWQQVAQATDSSTSGMPPITGSGLVGIRTDFMDASLRDYSVRELPQSS
ncbi:MAG: hypothetical protein K0S68_3 [Candidatus Saccharibacteria bacterium]|jgi:hypothetical protein|nr:hypothetical protein [Candidatus Saccharibacteria bacterium]